MGTEHVETAVEKVLAHIKDFFGGPSGNTTPLGEASPVARMTAPDAGRTSEDGAELFSDEYTFKSVAEVYTERARYEDRE